MAGDTFIDRIAGRWVQRRGTQVSAGAGNAGDILALGDDGYIDPSTLPPGVGPDVKVVVASEALAANDLVNLHDVTGAARVRKADAAADGKQAWGFVKASVLNGGNATVYFGGLLTGATGITAVPYYLSTTAGLFTTTAPTGAGQVQQVVGVGVSTTEIAMEIEEPVLLAS